MVSGPQSVLFHSTGHRRSQVRRQSESVRGGQVSAVTGFVLTSKASIVRTSDGLDVMSGHADLQSSATPDANLTKKAQL
jgi:hypothetical protein